jgi:TPR repeat protein
MADIDDLISTAINNEDFSEALRLCKIAEEEGSAYALLVLGWMFGEGKLGNPDKASARSYYERAIAGGEENAYLYLGDVLLYFENDRVAARNAYTRGESLGVLECKDQLESIDQNEKEHDAYNLMETKQFERAHALLDTLAGQGSSYALESLGWMYHSGKLGAPDIDRAKEYYERAIQAGSIHVYRDFGLLLLKEGDEVRARKVYLAGAEAGDAPCMVYVARMMIWEEGGPIDEERSRFWFEQAAAQGNSTVEGVLLIYTVVYDKGLGIKTRALFELLKLLCRKLGKRIFGRGA